MRVISPLNRVGLGIVALFSASILSFSTVFAAGAPAAAESIDQLYEKVKKEGGKLTVYAALSARSMEVRLTEASRERRSLELRRRSLTEVA